MGRHPAEMVRFRWTPDGWSAFVTAAWSYKKEIRHGEVWNEGNGFNDGKHTADYAVKLAAVTYAAVKKADPTAKVGLSSRVSTP